MQVDNLSIKEAYRMGTLKEDSNVARPIFVKFNKSTDRSRVWQAKKLLQWAPGRRIWVQEDMPCCLREDLRILFRIAREAESLQREDFGEVRVRDFQLLFQGKSYRVSELETLPVELRPSILCTRSSEEAIVFFGKYAPLSNHHRSPFSVKDTTYNTVEQYLAVAKANLSGKKELMEKAKTQSDQADSKKI